MMERFGARIAGPVSFLRSCERPGRLDVADAIRKDGGGGTSRPLTIARIREAPFGASLISWIWRVPGVAVSGRYWARTSDPRDVANFCPECRAAVERMRFCRERGTPIDRAPAVPTPVMKTLGEEAQTANGVRPLQRDHDPTETRTAEPPRCANCDRIPRPDEDPEDEWRAESDHVGELYVLPECWQREFGSCG